LAEEVDSEIVRLIRLTGRRESDILTARRDGGEKWDEISRQVEDHNRLISIGEWHTRQKAIQDPVHGAILFDPWELDLISTWEMLRLRYVMQLGPAHIVYPGATHTRFQHSLGTSFLAQKCIRVVNYCDNLETACFVPISQLLDSYHQKLFRASALLHDVGHPPTSHCIEYALQSWAGTSHTDLGEFLTLNSSLTDVLIHHDIDPKDIVSILKRRTSDPVMVLLSDFLDSPLDLDKTDYLIRDAHFSGVQLGVFPAERVLLTNRVVRDSKGGYVRAFMMKAIHSLEALILSRNWMFSDLYMHHAVKLAEALLSKATYFRLQEEDLSKNEVIGLFTRMVDSDLYRWLGESRIDFVRDYVSRIRYRRLFKVVTSMPLASFEPEVRKSFLATLSDIDRLVQIERSLSEEPGAVVVDIVVPELGEKMLSKIPLLVGGEQGLDLVSLDETKEGRPLMHLLSQQTRTIPSVRVYSDPTIAADVKKRFERDFPLTEQRTYRDDEWDLMEY
jgi:HD superfamily phosphohydrolase